MIRIQNLEKTYTTGAVITPVLRGITLDIKKGEYVAIMGKSGAGKSTLLYQMGLLDKPTTGSVMLDDVNTHDLGEGERTVFRLNHLGYVFQDYALVPELTALENVAIPLLMLGQSEKEAYAQALKMLEKIGLGHRMNNLPNQLSGGEQQRVSVARAVCHHPKILFADEPTANLDSASSALVLDVFDALHAEGQTIVMVTHEKEYAERAQRTIVIDDGIVKE
ncbi:MAG: ABC transporter ATP-binding protein [Candidatus Pacebacteria bacterium]|nr:ABC transporter ATP-binding protein [Candidatus Paceibacterota bacterium]